MKLIRRRKKGVRVLVSEMEQLEPISAPKPRLVRRRKRQIRLRARKEARVAQKAAVRGLRRRKRIKVITGGAEGSSHNIPMVNAEGGLNTQVPTGGKRSVVTGDLDRNIRGIGKSFIDSLTKVR